MSVEKVRTVSNVVEGERKNGKRGVENFDKFCRSAPYIKLENSTIFQKVELNIWKLQ